MRDYVRPTSVSQAISALEEAGDAGIVKMGGCQVVPLIQRGALADRVVVGLHGIPELRGVELRNGSGLRVGAAARLAELAQNPRLQVRYPVLGRTVGAVGSPAIRNMASLAGNVAAGLPNSDLVPVLAVVRGVAEIQGPAGVRSVPVDRLAERTPAEELARGEIISAVSLPEPPAGFRAGYRRFALRAALDRPIAAVAVGLELSDGACRGTRVALVGAGPTPIRAPAIEAALDGRPLTEETIAAAVGVVRETVEPRGDEQASGDYRRTLLTVLVRRALDDMSGDAPAGSPREIDGAPVRNTERE
jgi:CO/xanthine dehydrogenase FAD-binding subunit